MTVQITVVILFKCVAIRMVLWTILPTVFVVPPRVTTPPDFFVISLLKNVETFRCASIQTVSYLIRVNACVTKIVVILPLGYSATRRTTIDVPCILHVQIPMVPISFQKCVNVVQIRVKRILYALLTSIDVKFRIVNIPMVSTQIRLFVNVEVPYAETVPMDFSATVLKIFVVNPPTARIPTGYQ